MVTAGAVSRTFPIPGIADNAIGLKTIEEAVAIRDRLMSNFDKASTLPPGPERDRLLTVVVIGGGFAGIEVFAELRSFASALVERYPQITFDDTHFHLVEAMGRIMPEVSLEDQRVGAQGPRQARRRTCTSTRRSPAPSTATSSSRPARPSRADLIIWTAGVMANPTVVRGGDLPVEERGRIRTRADLRVGIEDEFVEGAWAAGDVSAVPDLSGGGVGGYCVPNAQHAVRQAKLLAKNLVAVLRGEVPREYFHKNIGAVAGLGLVQRRVPVGQPRPEGLRRLGRAPRLPRPGHAHVGAQVPRVLGLVEQPLARPRPRDARGAAEPAPCSSCSPRGPRPPAEAAPAPVPAAASGESAARKAVKARPPREPSPRHGRRRPVVAK